MHYDPSNAWKSAGIHHRSVVIIGLLSAGSSVAQEYRGRVQGLVTDSSQASVVGARITLRNVNTGIESVQRSNELGQYLFVSTLSKFFPIGERIKLQFKMEVYNLANCFVPNDPTLTVASSLFGSTTSQSNMGRQM